MNTAFLKAYEVLDKIYTDKAFSSIELNRQLTTAKQSDKALISKIVYGVLDCDIELDYIVKQYVKRSNHNAQLFLKIGIYCLKCLSIPPYAVVNDIAELSKIRENKHLVGFVNATLKAISNALSQNILKYPVERTELLSVKHSYPMWALLKLIKDYGIDEAEKIVSFTLPSDTTIRVNTSKITISDFEKLLKSSDIAYQKTVLDDAFCIKGVPNIDTGLFTSQSLSSMLVSLAVATVGQCNVLDCCSAPGGKAIYLKQLNPQAEITACDIHPHRVELINSYAERMGVEIQTACCDSTVFEPSFEQKFDYVLCDVPCSGFGVLDSRPDIKLNRTSLDISNLMKLQSAILNNVAKYVKPNGILVYSTCTVFKNENSEIIKKFLKINPNFEFSAINLPFESNANGTCEYQFLPYKDGVQGFYCARLRRI